MRHHIARAPHGRFGDLQSRRHSVRRHSRHQGRSFHTAVPGQIWRHSGRTLPHSWLTSAFRGGLQQQLVGSNGSSPFDIYRPLDVPVSLDGSTDEHRHHEHQADGGDEHSQAGPTPAIGRAVYEVLRIDTTGKTRKIYVKRRDLLRANGLQPRDLRRIDPSLSLTKTAPNITVKENVILVNLGGVRAIIAAEKCLLFEPKSPFSRQFLDVLALRLPLQGQRHHAKDPRGVLGSFSELEERYPPFELECVEAALVVATGRLDGELVAVTKRVSAILQMLPRDITPVNLEELRRVKQALVELESKGDNLRDMLEEVMDDEDEVREMNLSARPAREERRRARERERLERGVEREREREQSRSSSPSGRTSSETSSHGGHVLSPWEELAASSPRSSRAQHTGEGMEAETAEQLEADALERAANGEGASSPYSGAPAQAPYMQQWDRSDWQRQEARREEGESGGAEAALEELEDAEAEGREVEEAEDLLEYYLQRAATTQSEAERLLAGARDLEESIGVSLSARRFEVNRLELALSIGSFAAAMGAMVAGIFGMNLRSTLENSVVGFWGTTAFILLGCAWLCGHIFWYTRRRRIL